MSEGKVVEMDLVTSVITIRSHLCDGGGLAFLTGYDPDTNSRNMTFSWLLGPEDGPDDLRDKNEGDLVYLNQYDDIDAMKRFLRSCLSAVETLEGQMERLPS